MLKPALYFCLDCYGFKMMFLFKIVSFFHQLVNQGLTESKMITIAGASHGGLLVTACANKRPDLFGCILSDVGLMDMLRFDKLGFGQAMVEEFGNPEIQRDFINLISYSPLHNIPKDKPYPPILLLAGDSDLRAPACHSMKFTAELQLTLKSSQFETEPALLRVFVDGHGLTSTVVQNIDKATDKLTFLHKIYKK